MDRADGTTCSSSTSAAGWDTSRKAFGQGELNEDAVNGIVVVELFYGVEEVGFGLVGCQGVFNRIYADVCTGFAFAFDVGYGCRIVADEYDREAGGAVVICFEVPDFFDHFSAHGFGQVCAVYDFCHDRFLLCECPKQKYARAM